MGTLLPGGRHTGTTEERQVFAPKTGGTLMTKMITEQDLLDLASMREDYFCSPQHTDSAL